MTKSGDYYRMDYLWYSVYSYLLTKLHIVSKIKEFAYNVLSFNMYF